MPSRHIIKPVVAAGDPHTARAGAEILRAGGTAVDAAIGATFAAFAAEPVLTGPFGGGFATVGGGDGESLCVDFFSDIPGRGLVDAKDQPELDFVGLDVNFGATTQTFHVGRGAAATPTLLQGLLDLHAREGRLPLSDIVAPAVSLARNGVPLSARIAFIVSILGPILKLTPESSRLFAPGGELLGKGDAFVNLDLASLLEELAHGRAADNDQRLLLGFGSPVGRITREDLEARQVYFRAPFSIELRGHTILLNPPPASGGILIAFGLRLLEVLPPSVWSDETETALSLLAAMATTNEFRARELQPPINSPLM